ncbi:MAG: division/cell wall cluster transcriptional repressor MraZ [Candidatus Omnitrophica bacterium]|nr:division/cell wall cluster transcriptional repressor MraZ [Candidatus Omnitrophota bacterium]MCK5288963.1 division/cell wall cluster transcriptional repressor MraZ [Candidatus Omnitrophota bacterium]MCK5491539.1 division/cell wall cluster transcriptional repressor MraZ [Candidatus Omnitrophota bacterium]
MWYGEYTHTIDEKDRFILPAKFREKIKTLKERNLYITRGLDGCLFLFAEEAWRKLEDKLKSLSFTKQQSRHFNRLYFSGASEVDIDTQGRITITEYLKEFAQIKREIVIIGVSDRIEVWDKLRWNKFFKENQKNFEEMSEDLFEM